VTALWELDARELLAGYGAGAFSAVEAVDACAARIAGTQGATNAWMELCVERARDEAHAADDAWREGGARALEGVPFGVKDLFDTEDVRTTYGSPIYDGHVPGADARAVAQARAAGAILIGKTGTDEFAYGIAGANPHYGAVRNPWAADRVSGGSSSGSGAAMAARCVPLALGSDTGGSIRSPSSFCGTVGLKGTWGAISAEGMWAMGRTLDHAGVMARTPADAALLHGALCEGTAGRPIAAALAGGLALPSGTRVGRCADLEPIVLAPAVASALAGALSTLSAIGCRVADVSFPEAPLLRTTFTPIRDAETLYTHRVTGLFPDRRAEYSRLTWDRLEAALPVGLDEYLVASAARWRLAEAFDALFDTVDVIVAPISADTAPPIDQPDPDGAAWALVGAHATPFNLLGIPALAFRAGFDEAGLPVGLQLVGRSGTDALVLAAAQAFYDATPELQARWPSPG
jgi:aspartyl-tRNA(Asn)/glutamyl-tRNA(Gln) amidotransferase subunit A